MRRLCLFLVTILTSVEAAAQTHPDSAGIDEANRLGRMLYAYDQAAWHGSDAVMALLRADPTQTQERVRGYVVEPEADGWRVSFGRLSADSAAFLSAFEAHLDSGYVSQRAEVHPDPVRRTGFPREAMRALTAATARFVPSVRVAYNSAVLPAPDGRIYVYLLPAQPAMNVYHVGADVRYTFDSASGSIVEETPLHRALNTFDFRKQPSASTFSTAVLTDIPTETDVFFAVSQHRRTVLSGAHYVMADNWVFVLDRTGIAAAITMEAWNAAGGAAGRGQRP